MFDFDGNPPNYPPEPSALPTKRAAEVEEDYKWVERYIPYDAGAESYVHWFLRFK